MSAGLRQILKVCRELARPVDQDPMSSEKRVGLTAGSREIPQVDCAGPTPPYLREHRGRMEGIDPLELHTLYAKMPKLSGRQIEDGAVGSASNSMDAERSGSIT